MWKLFVASLVACLCSTFQIYQTAVVNNIFTVAKPWLIEQTESTDGVSNSSLLNSTSADTPRVEYLVDLEWSFLTSSVPIGKVIGVITAGEVSDRLGRTFALRIVAFLMTIGGVLTGICKVLDSIYYAIAGRFISGIALGLGVNACSLFLVETAPKEYRGRFLALTQVTFSLGDLSAIVVSMPQVMGTESLWPLALALSSIPAPICFIYLLFVPETPRHLLLKEKAESLKALRAINYFQSEKEAKETLDDILREKRRLDIVKSNITYMSLFTGYNLRSTLLVCWISGMDQLTGINVVIVYSTILLQTAGFSYETAAICTLILGVIKFVTNLPVPWMLDRYGRRLVILWGVGGCFLSNSLAILSFATMKEELVPYVVLFSFVLYMTSFSLSSSGIMVLGPEMFMQDLRGKGMMVGMTIRWTLASIVTGAFLMSLESWGAWLSLLPYALCSFVFLISLLYVLPETKQRSFSMIVGDHSFDMSYNAGAQPLLERNSNESLTYGSLSK